ncbi:MULTISPECIES: hypothetical protein [Nocardia]|uniref:hypothetical protein n=1 Tax=Nocardia TaxID=1817 RepID=UPI0007A43D22|nr:MULTISPECIES: hypothetical protein [Nocardia]
MIDYDELERTILKTVWDELKRQRKNAKEGLIESLDEADVTKTYEDAEDNVWSHRGRDWGFEYYGSEWRSVSHTAAYDDEGPFKEVIS